MLTLKYIASDASETIGEYEGVTAEVIDGYRVVRAYNQTERIQFGPVRDRGAAEIARPTVYVINRCGATIATYDL